MNFEIKGVATTPKHNSKISSSTQLAKGWRPHSHYAHIRPNEVPSLDLGKLGDSDDEDCYAPLSKGYPRFGPPDSSSTVSWGTPLNTPYAQHFQTQRIIRKHSPIKTEIPNPEEKDFSDTTHLDEKAHLPHCYTSKPYTVQHSMRKLEAEDLAAERKKQAVVEQVMIDHLSRAVISHPEQNANSVIVDNLPQDLSSAPLRFRKRTLHETKIKTSTAFTENMLTNKLRFDARIICRNGRDACRELIGFFFVHDKSLTIYEYRQFGKNRTNALPFIQKGIYRHQCGHKQGKLYELRDFYTGANLTFLTEEHQTLPESIKQNSLLNIRITDIDEEATKSLRVHFEENKLGFDAQLNEDNSVLLAVQDVMKEKLKNRGIRTLTRLGKYFRQLDKKGTGTLRKTDFKQALKTFHLDISETAFEPLWTMFDEKNTNEVDYRTFFYALIGEMNEYRKSFVRKAFMKLDPNKTGMVSMVDLRKFYCANKHPQVLNGASEEEIHLDFSATMENACSNPKEVSYSEFEDYYEGLSTGIPDDDDFINILRHSWGI
ncbi:calcyphosin-2 [Discoglossus pictus]